MPKEETNVYIVLYEDKTLQFFNNEYSARKEHFANNTQCFKTSDDTTAILICEWIGRGYKHNQITRVW